MQDNLDWQDNFPRDTVVVQNLKAPEKSWESKIAENNKICRPFFFSSLLSFRLGQFQQCYFWSTEKRKFRLEIRSALWVQSCKSALGRKWSSILGSWDSKSRHYCAWVVAPAEAASPGSVCQGSGNRPLWTHYQTVRDACHFLAFLLLKITSSCQLHRVCNPRKCHK